MMEKQAEMEQARIEAEQRAEAQRRTLQMMSGGTREGAIMVGAAMAAAPMVDAMGKAMDAVNDHFPMTFELEVSARAFFDGGTGHAVAFRAPGFFYFRMGYESYDAGDYDRVFAYSAGMGLQLPMTPGAIRGW